MIPLTFAPSRRQRRQLFNSPKSLGGLKIGDRTMRIAFREIVPNVREGERITLVETVDTKVEVLGSSTKSIVGFSYAINNAKYAEYLDAHGIAS